MRMWVEDVNGVEDVTKKSVTSNFMANVLSLHFMHLRLKKKSRNVLEELDMYNLWCQFFYVQ